MGSIPSLLTCQQHTETKRIVKMKLLSVILIVEVAFTQAKFCPKEKNGDRCKSKPNAYKCAAFFEDLQGKGDGALKWIGALPDALKKVKKEDYQEVLGRDISPDSFNEFSACSNKAANARCYTTLQRFTQEPMDSCTKNLVNTKGAETVGDYLCGQVRRWLKNDADFNAHGKEDIKIVFRYSQCGSEWAAVDSDGTELYPAEALCCSAEGFFYRCDGTDYNKICDK